jgi:hypothetical protein
LANRWRRPRRTPDPTSVADFDDAAVADRHDADAAEELVDAIDCATDSPCAGTAAAAARRLRGGANAPREGVGTAVNATAADVTRGDADLSLFRGAVAEARRVPLLHRVDRPLGQAAALQDAVLRLIEIVVEPGFLRLEHLIERRHVRRVLLDQQLRASLVDRRRPERVHTADHEDDEERRQGDPAPFVEDADVVQQVFLSGAGCGAAADE